MNSSFLNNSAFEGGAIYASMTINSNLNITNCNFTNNNANISGGAV